MSTEAINRCKRIRQDIVDYEPVEPLRVYPIVKTSVAKAQKIMGLWFDAYEEYAKQIQDEVIKPKDVDQQTANQIINLISSWVTSGEARFGNIVRARIPTECYLLIQEFYSFFRKDPSFVLQEYRGFSSNPMIEDFKEELREMKLTRPSDLDPILLDMRNQAVTKITYDATEYNSAQSWLVMLHEVGHQLYDEDNLYSHNPFRTEIQMKEVFVDLLVLNVFGQSYAIALAAYHRNYPVGGITHPVEPARLYALVKGSAALLGRSNKNQGYYKSVERAAKTIAKYWSKLKNEFVKEQADIKNKFEPINKAVLGYLQSMNIKTFEQFCSKYEQESSRNDPPFDQVERMIKEEIPVALDSRRLYAAISEYGTITSLLVCQSLKRWYVRRNWKEPSPQQSMK